MGDELHFDVHVDGCKYNALQQICNGQTRFMNGWQLIFRGANPCAAEMGRKMVKKKINKVLKKAQMTEMVRRIMVKVKQSLVNKVMKMMAVKQSHAF
ncbi:putative histone H2B subacrosomal variant-like [Sesbania bispinosa]|nr:putative histone H2B subacrosomal variant-like [Sesbania bispinosa]